MTVDLPLGDCLEVMRMLGANTVDSIVTDPPYGLEFMGVAWDTFSDGSKGTGRTRNDWGDFGSREHARHPSEAAGIQRKKAIAFEQFSGAWAAEALRVAKPGAHLLTFGGTRTWHRLTVALEDAGWEIRDTIMWVYGSGFPKSLDVSKAIDKEAHAEREVAGPNVTHRDNYNRSLSAGQPRKNGMAYGEFAANSAGCPQTMPATDGARQWQGWGTALKPAWEPVIVARKPLEGTVAANVLRWGTGAINVDGCRIEGIMDGCWGSRQETRVGYRFGSSKGYRTQESPLGRWPANLIHDGSDEVVGLFPAEAPSGRGNKSPRNNHLNVYGKGLGWSPNPSIGGDSGSAARFFYCAKASKSDRDEGCEGLEEKKAGKYEDDAYEWPDGRNSKCRNFHPTVKPTALMRYLCRLVTPPGGLVLDPFMGSGSTGKAAVLEGFGFAGVEIDAGYMQIARARIAAAQAQLRLPLEPQPC